MNRLRRRIPWIIAPFLLIVPMILVACGSGGLTPEQEEQLAGAAAGAAAAQAAAEEAQRGVEAIDTEAIVSSAVEEALAMVPEPPPGITAEDVSSAISMAIAEIPEGITADDVAMAAQDAAEQVAAGTLQLGQVESAIAMALDKAAEEAAMMAMKAEEDAAMMAMKEEEERIRQIYADFFSDQTIRLIVGFRAGGGYDTYGRLIARHIPNHIPGNPTIVVTNEKTGGGSVEAAKYLYNEVDPDGLTLGLWNSNHIFVAALGDSAELQFLRNSDDFGWLGAPSDGNPVCAIMGRVGVTDANEILAPETTYKHGATGASGGSLSDIPLMTNAFIGTDHEVVHGYSGTSAIRIALEQGEVDAACWGWESMSGTARAMLDAEGDERFIPYAKLFPSDDPEIADLPLLGDFITDPGQKALFDLWAAGYRFQRGWTTPPGTAPELVAILQQAFADALADPALIEEAKAANRYLNPQTGADIVVWVSEILSVTDEQREALQFLVDVEE